MREGIEVISAEKNKLMEEKAPIRYFIQLLAKLPSAKPLKPSFFIFPCLEASDLVEGEQAEMFGSPGRMSGLVLRCAQWLFAAVSIGFMVTAPGFFNSTAFCLLNNYLIASMGLQILWSFGLACLDLHALRMKKSLRNSVLLCLFAIGDWVVSTLSLAAASSSAGVAILYSRDLDYCRSPPYISCSKIEISVAFAFISWFLLVLSSLVTFWLLGTV
uniref:CASP-like protein n=1 Tax=Cucumis melo TaxID=3656 RepID=A0A9I9CTI4_CUCME